MILQVWFKYVEGATTLPDSPLESPKQAVTALAGSTPIPGFDVTKACTDYAYQVRRRGHEIMGIFGAVCREIRLIIILNDMVCRHAARTKLLVALRSVAW